ncbi:MAG: hypothetical protein ACRC0W_00325 [Cetobacterium sp.]
MLKKLIVEIKDFFSNFEIGIKGKTKECNICKEKILLDGNEQFEVIENTNRVRCRYCNKYLVRVKS